MKLNVLLLFILLSSTITFSQRQYARLDNERGTSMEPILARAEPLIEKIEKEDFEIVRMEFDIISTEKVTYRTLYKDWEYGIVAFGDYRIKDIDVAVYEKVRGKWKLFEKDAENDDEAMVTIKPYKDGEHKIKISVYKFNKDYAVGHYGLLVIHE
jgi:hypothetical protein